MLSFKNKILFLGYGAVARCALPVFLRHIDADRKNITVMDFEDRREGLQPWLAEGLRFVQERVTPENLGRTLGRYLSRGDLLIDLAWNIDCCELLQWCHDRGVLYANTSVEVWDPYADSGNKPPTERTLYWRHMNLRRLIAGWKDRGPTAVVEHGANPGLISHWTKQGLIDLGRRLLDEGKAFPSSSSRRPRSISPCLVQCEINPGLAPCSTTAVGPRSFQPAISRRRFMCRQ